ncbi:OmpH family outer membrane protein [Sphingomonas canadensis]|uniref:OmpH family outer membrane protein n=1 Tax=Sphingomonas canadensis TaxID=1219257 RepID=A0ABW3HF99_9SPHN|nr:OmpH family outer membrane protein [Sphingomonas canadensis]MCW3838001.1 OmpH family outer membrane protein [Sphingomonas canadensis]
MKLSTWILAAAAAPAAIAAAAPAQAQVAGIAQADPVVAIGNSKAYTTLVQSVETMFKSNLDQAKAKEAARQALLAPLDKNGDGTLDENEQNAAIAAKNPAVTQANALDAEIGTLTDPVARAQAYGVQQLYKGYETALKKVVTDKKINVVLSPSAFIYAPDSSDITATITAEIDKQPAIPVTAPPSNWQPSRDLINMQQQLVQYRQILRALAERARAANPAPGAPAPAAPAALKPQQPSGR